MTGLIGPSNRRHLLIEIDVVVEVEVLRIGSQVVQRLRMAGIMRIMARHAKVAEFGQPFGRNQARCRVHAAVLTAKVPIAAHVILLLDAVDIEPSQFEILRCRQPGRPSPDHAVA